MKKFLIIALLVLSVCVLFSCNNGTKTDHTTAAETTEVEATSAETTAEEITAAGTIEVEATTEEDTTVEETTEEETTEEETTERPVIVGTYDVYDLDTAMKPIWEGRVVHNETVMFLDVGDTVSLMYKPEQIISVRSIDLKTEYEKGKDYDVTEDGKLVLLEGTSINYIGTEKYYTQGDAAYLQTKRDGKTSPLYFSERIYQYQVAVTYQHNEYWGDKFVPTTSDRFAGLKEKLEKGEDVTMIFYGDSITYGASASAILNAAPKQDTWPEMVTLYMAEKYGYTVHFVNTKLQSVFLGHNSDVSYGNKGTITYINAAVGGWTSTNGFNSYDTYVRPFIEEYGCDFFLLGFGMNDGGNSAKTEKKAIKKITDLVYGQVPNTEIALLATMVPNPDTTNGWYGNQEKFEPAFIELADEYQKDGKKCGVIRMTTMSLSVLTVKNFRDYTGNNVNHPNDFFARVYAQTIYQTVIGY